MNTHRNEEGKKGFVATCVCDTTSGCSLFLFAFDVMVGLIYEEELSEIPGCDGISTPPKKNWELLWKSGRLRAFSHKKIPFHTPLQCRPMSQSVFLLLILKKLFSVPPEIDALPMCVLCTARLRFRLCG